jgi:hypothetical protein
MLREGSVVGHVTRENSLKLKKKKPSSVKEIFGNSE